MRLAALPRRLAASPSEHSYRWLLFCGRYFARCFSINRAPQIRHSVAQDAIRVVNRSTQHSPNFGRWLGFGKWFVTLLLGNAIPTRTSKTGHSNR
jgi:hypothetical protein